MFDFRLRKKNKQPNKTVSFPYKSSVRKLVLISNWRPSILLPSLVIAHSCNYHAIASNIMDHYVKFRREINCFKSIEASCFLFFFLLLSLTATSQRQPNLLTTTQGMWIKIEIKYKRKEEKNQSLSQRLNSQVHISNTKLEKGDHYYIQTRHKDLFSHYNLILRKL